MCLLSEEKRSNNNESECSRRKPLMLRKRSGELVRPALRLPSSRRRPSSMPGTLTFSKAVHFDQHLEYARHFLRFDKPLAVTAGSSPVESYEIDTFSDEDSQNPRGPPFEWEIVVSNFPAQTLDRLRQPVRVEQILLSMDNKTLLGSVAVANFAFQKIVAAQFTLDYWKTTSEVLAEYNNDIHWKPQADGYDQFKFNINLADQANLEAKTMLFCVKYAVNGIEYWDNNNSRNFQVEFRKKAKQQSWNGLPRSQKKSASLRWHHSMPATLDDFVEGFDFAYDFSAFSKRPVSHLLDETGSARLSGIESAADISLDILSRKPSSPSGQAFSNRYDFNASLSATIQAANTATGGHSGTAVKPSAKMLVGTILAPAVGLTKETPIPTVASLVGMNSPGPAGSDKPMLASQSYNELLDKYCFFGSAKSSPHLKEEVVRFDPPGLALAC